MHTSPSLRSFVCSGYTWPVNNTPNPFLLSGRWLWAPSGNTLRKFTGALWSTAMSGPWAANQQWECKVYVDWEKEIPTPRVLLHCQAELWGAWGVSPLWRELAPWLYSVFLGLGETADVFSQLKIHWTCLYTYLLAAIPPLWHAIKAAALVWQAQGLCFHLSTTWGVTVSTITVYSESCPIVQEPWKSTKEFVVVSPPWSWPMGPQMRGLRKAVSRERGRPI